MKTKLTFYLLMITFLSVLYSPVLAQTPEIIYDDALGQGWQDWSWTTHDLNNISPTHDSSAKSISVDYTPWGALSFYNNQIVRDDWEYFEFYIHGGTDGGQQLSVYAEDDDTGEGFPPVNLNSPQYIADGTIQADIWKRARIPIADLQITTTTFTRLSIMDRIGSPQPRLYIDDILLIPPEPGPHIISAAANGAAGVIVFFDRKLAEDTATEPTNYELTSADDPNYATAQQPATATYDASTRSVTLLFLQDFIDGATYVLTINNVEDTEGYLIAPNSTVSFIVGILGINIDVTANVHAISPLIYGMASAPDVNYMQDAGVTVNRWGGNHNSRYNWKIGAANRDADWYFENFDKGDDNGEAVITFAQENAAANARTILTIPMLDWVAKDNDSYSYSVAKYGPQQDVDPWNPDAGNGIKLDGTPVENDPNDASVPARSQPRVGDPANTVYMSEWIQYLQDNGITIDFYAMDNESDIWGETHRDVHPDESNYDELYDKFIEYATMVKSIIPDAQITGPVSCCWWYYWNSQAGPDDKAAHGDVDFLPWFLQNVKAHDDATGQRTLDVLDIHYYPTEVVFVPDETSPEKNAMRLRATRSLWDETYKDEGWIGERGQDATQTQPNPNYVYLIPRMKVLIEDYYPGTKLAITEWNFGAEETLNGALAICDVLGIFGREYLYLANYWTHPEETEPGYQAFKLYGNYDGSGGKFGDTSVMATTSDTSKLTAYAALSSDTQELTLVVINKHPEIDYTTTINIAGYTPEKNAEVYQYSDVDLTQILRRPDITLSPGFEYTFPRYSATLIKFAQAEEFPVGDVSGDYTVSAYDAALILQYVVGLISEFPVKSMMAAEKAKPYNYRLNIPDQSVRVGESIIVPVEINQASVLAGGMTLRYDSSDLRATNVFAEMSGAYWESNITDDQIRIAFARIKASEGGPANLFYIKFDVLANQPGVTTEIRFDHVQLAESLSIITHNGSITILPEKSSLLQNFPNPFNPETWIPFKLAQNTPVTINIYDIKGQLIRTISLGNKPAGVYTTKDKAAHWDGKDSLGEKVASGVYYYTLQVEHPDGDGAGEFRATKKMVIMK